MIVDSWQRAFQIEYRIKPSLIFNSSLKIIESAMFDFMIGNYISSYVCLVPVIETALMQWAEELDGEVISKDSRGFNKFKFIDNLVDYLNNKNDNIESNPEFKEWIYRHIEHFEYIIKYVFYQKFEDSETGVEKQFNRNRTLHFLDGLEDPIVVRDNNIRIFLLIDVMAELYLALDSCCYYDNTLGNDPETNTDFNLRWTIYKRNSLNRTKYTDMNIIRYAFLDENEKLILSEEDKLKFLEQIKLQISEQ